MELFRILKSLSTAPKSLGHCPENSLIGPQKKHMQARQHILDLLLGVLPAGTTVYPHFTCATGESRDGTGYQLNSAFFRLPVTGSLKEKNRVLLCFK